MLTLNELKQKYGSISIHLATKDRAGELAVCLQALRMQTYDLWDLIICDDGSSTQTFEHQIVFKLLDRIRFGKHKIKTLKNEMSMGVCRTRQILINNDKYNNLLTLRLDDDCIPEKDYIEKLVRGIDMGYDLMTGVVPLVQTPEIKRQTKFIKPIVDEMKIDNNGKIILYKDDCGNSYAEDEILPLHHFRSCALYKKEITDNGVMYPMGINWFREESFFSIQAILKGYLLGCHTNAVAYHYQNSTGGCRPLYQQNIVALDQQNWEMWLKRQYLKYKEKHGTNFIDDYNKKLKEKGLLK